MDQGNCVRRDQLHEQCHTGKGFCWALLGKASPDMGVMVVSTAVVIALLFGGVVYFKRMEQTFADVI